MSTPQEMAAKMKTLDYRRRFYKGRLTQIETYVQENAATADSCDIDVRLEAMKNWKRSVELIQDELEELNPEEMEGDERITFEERFMTVEAALLRIKRRLPREGSIPMSSLDVSGAQAPTEISFVRNEIPEIELPKFDGHYLNWISFKNAFDVLIHNSTAKGMDDTKKLSYLKACVRGGRAEDIIRHLDLIPANYEKAREMLTERFFKKRLIFESYIRRLLEIPSCPSQSLRYITDHFVANRAALDGISSPEEQAQGIMIALALQKLDKGTRTKWEELSSTKVADLPNWKEFADFLNKRCDALEHVDFASKPVQSSNIKEKKMLLGRADSCVVCENACESVFKCSKFLSSNPKQRSELARELKLCFRCLEPLPHEGGENCDVVCTVESCKGGHNFLLHFSKKLKPKSKKKDHPEKEKTVACGISIGFPLGFDDEIMPLTTYEDDDVMSTHQLMATAELNISDKYGNSTSLRALIDTGSQLNLIKKAALRGLAVETEKIQVRLSGIHGNNAILSTAAKLKFSSKVSKFAGVFRAAIIAKFEDKHPNFPLDKKSLNIPKNLQLADPKFNYPRGIDLIIGVDLAFRLLCVGQIQRGPSCPILQKSLLGWLVIGNVSTSCLAGNLNLTSLTASTELLQRFWEVDELTMCKPILSQEQKSCEEKFMSTVNRTEVGKFIVELPFKRDPAILGESFYVATKYLASLEKLFSRKPEMRQLYDNFMAEYESLGHMEEIIMEPRCKYNFIPHHPILKESSSTTKLREVFNASQPTSSGVSLNECLEVGPKIQSDLIDILVRFRGHKVGVSGDIEKMYRQIEVAPHHRKFQCILWRRPESKKTSVFQLNTLTYGTASAPYLAIRCLHELAYTDTTHPIARDALLHDFYVDDVLSGADTVAQALALYTELTELLGSAGMHIRKWCSNSVELLNEIPQVDQETLVRIGDEEFTKTLGLKWETKTDKFMFVPEEIDEAKWTLRKVTSTMAKIFDPLGLVSPVVVKMKILIQRLWVLKLKWDESLPLAEHTMWCKLMADVTELRAVRVPRYIGDERHGGRLELHVFSDASVLAYGCVAYIRILYPNGDVTINMIASKARVAPLKKKTLARLELLGAYVMSELQQRLRNVLPLKFESVHLWVDSMVALTWVTSSPHKYETWVANRISYIQDRTENVMWHHVPGDVNPADIVSRGASPKKLVSANYWLNGPQFLYEKEFVPHTSNVIDPADPDLECIKKKFTLISPIVADPVAIVAAQGNLMRLKILFFFLGRIYAKKAGEDVKDVSRDDKLSPQQLDDGLKFAISIVQKVHFLDVLDTFEKDQPLPARHNLNILRPFLDEKKMIRVGGRLDNAPISYDAKHPMLLPKKHALSELLVK